MGQAGLAARLGYCNAESALLVLGPDKPVPIFCGVQRLDYSVFKDLTMRVGLLLIAPGLRSRFSPGAIFYVKGLVGCAVGAVIAGIAKDCECQAWLGASR